MEAIKSAVQTVLDSFGGAIPTVKSDVLQRLYKQKDYPSMLGWIKNSMRLELRVGLRIVDKIDYNHPMWIEIPKPIPVIGTPEFKNTRVTVNVTRDTIDTKPFDWIVAGLAHELSHVVLFSIGHKLQEEEKAVDLTAMILGFENFEVTAQLTEPDRISVGGYLTLPERKFAAAYLTEIRRARERGSASFDHSKSRSERQYTARQAKCGVCGKINRVSHGAVGSKPMCGNCRSPLPQSSGEAFVEKAFLVMQKIDAKVLVVVGFVI